MSEPKYRKEKFGDLYDLVENQTNILIGTMFDENGIDSVLTACNNFDKAVELLRVATKAETATEFLNVKDCIDQFLAEVNDDTKV